MKTPNQNETESQPRPLGRKRDVARILDVTERHVDNLIKKGVIKPIRLGRAVRFDLVGVLESVKQEATA
jgi:predicted DNA-binding transcriptional regulator AlpA